MSPFRSRSIDVLAHVGKRCGVRLTCAAHPGKHLFKALFIGLCMIPGASAWNRDCTTGCHLAQDPLLPDSATCRDVADAVAEHAGDESGEELFEELVWLADHPYDLNTAPIRELLRVPGMLPADVDVLERARRRAGKFTAVEQLQRYGAEGRRLYYLLAPFVSVEGRRHLSVRTRSRICWRSADADRGKDAPRLGPPMQELHHLDFRLWEGVSGGVRMCRDAGEPYRYAFFSGYLRVPDLPLVDELLLGDFRAATALGLVLGSSNEAVYGAFRGAGAVPRIVPYHGSSGRNLLRGAALSKTLRFFRGTFSLRALLSRVALSASVDASGRITGIDESPEFTTTGSAGKRNNTADLTGALCGSYMSTSGFSLGATLVRSALTRAFAGTSAGVRPQTVTAFSIDGSFDRGPLSVSAEYARANGGTAVGGRVGLSLERNTALEILLWRYEKDYWCGTSGSFSSGGEVRNDAGIRVSWVGRVSSSATCAGYVEHWRRPWRTTLDPSPPSGVEGSVSVTVRLAPRIVCEGRYSHSRSEHAIAITHRRGLHDVDMTFGARDYVRCSADVGLGRRADLRCRVDWCCVTGPGGRSGGKGWGLTQELRLAPAGLPRVVAAVTVVETDSYASRLYVRERDVDGAYANPACSGSGIRWYVLIRQPIGTSFVLSAKYASSTTASGAFARQEADAFTAQIDFLAGEKL